MNPTMKGSNGMAGLALNHPPMLALSGQQQNQQHNLLPFQSSASKANANVELEHSSSTNRSSCYTNPLSISGKQQQQLHHPRPTMSAEDDATANSPWQRMKWTDDMIRLLINVVYHVGDDADCLASALLQKRGKWKSVSLAMIKKGFHVSPQQCEDKFNDLNKRYKRVVDLLGRGQACRVVENHVLLETMDHLSDEAKEEVRKLLKSKHLLFPEMCAYHNAGGGTCHSSGSDAAQPKQLKSEQYCFHNPPGHGEPTMSSLAPVKVTDIDDDTSSDEEDYDDDKYSSEDEEDYDDGEDDKKMIANKGNMNDKAEEESNLISPEKRKTTGTSINMQQLKSELRAMGDGVEKQTQWLKRKAEELEEKNVECLCKALRLEREMFKWLEFSAKKERNLKRLKLDNDRKSLENDRMLMMLQKKELELQLQQIDNQHATPPSAAA